jgi:hypothetical protein
LNQQLLEASFNERLKGHLYRAQSQYPVQPETGFSTHYNDPRRIMSQKLFYPRQRFKVAQKLHELSFNYFGSISPYE